MQRMLMLGMLLTLQVHIRWGAGLPPPQTDGEGDPTEQHNDGSGQQPQRQRRQEQARQRKAEREKRQKAAKELSPYCTVAAGPSAGVSRPASGGRDAQWRETFFLYIRCASYFRLKIYQVLAFLTAVKCRRLKHSIFVTWPTMLHTC